jgi:steroid 5-alpha reductase family enzyme
LIKRREGYDDYMARTPTFFPRSPKELPSDV